MTYNVFGGTLSLTQSVNSSDISRFDRQVHTCTVYCFDSVTGCREEGRSSLTPTVV